MLSVLTLTAVELPAYMRVAICVALATPGIVAIRAMFLLRGRNAVHALTWTGTSPVFNIQVGPARSECRAALGAGSFRLGSLYLVLLLRAPGRTHPVFIDGRRQDIRAFRGLCRHLRWPPRDP